MKLRHRPLVWISIRPGREVRVDGSLVELTYTEFELLNYLVANTGVALSRDKILDNVWRYDYYGDARTVDTHVKSCAASSARAANTSRPYAASATNLSHRPLQGGFLMSAETKRRHWRSSILWKLCGSVLLCICLMMLFNWLLNNFVLVSYYQKAKEKSLIHAFTAVNTLSREESSIGDTLYELSISQNISTVIWSPPNHLKYDYSPVKTNETRLLLSPPYGTLAQSPLLPGEYLLEVTDDTRLNSHFLTLSGKLDNEDLILMRTSVASIEDSVGITNRFLLISGSISLLLGGLLTFWMARTFTRPIRALSRVAGSVARLDFSDRYDGHGRDELADLGNSINSMSESLERVISELRAANLRLERDIRQKEKQNEAHRAFIANVSHELKTPDCADSELC